MPRILVIGGGGHAKVVISLLNKIREYQVVGYVDTVNHGVILGVPYLGTDDVLPGQFARGTNLATLGIGQLKTAELRRRLRDKAIKIGYVFPAVISPTAIINEDVHIGAGTVVMDGVVVNSGSRIGCFSIVNTRSSIDHDCQVGNFVHVAPGVTLSGGVTIEDDCLIGTGATVIQYKKICSGCVVGAGSVVTTDLLCAGTYLGIPARGLQ
ncbi:MAG: acetyltransferase [Gemmatimonadetes bacterium]|nr:MAG: acetyltransferase [Gemmatimonadota bacterium]